MNLYKYVITFCPSDLQYPPEQGVAFVPSIGGHPAQFSSNILQSKRNDPRDSFRQEQNSSLFYLMSKKILPLHPLKEKRTVKILKIMYAIVDIAGQQHKVKKKQKIYVHRLDAAEGSQVEFNKVLLVDNEGAITVGMPFVTEPV